MLGIAYNMPNEPNFGPSFTVNPDNSGIIMSSLYPDDLESLLEIGVNEKVILDQLRVANRVNSLLTGIRGWVEDSINSVLGRVVSGHDRHSLTLMCSYGDGSPLKEFRLRAGYDSLEGKPIDLMGKDKTVRKTLKVIRGNEGIGSLVINGKYSLYHSGVRLPQQSYFINQDEGNNDNGYDGSNDDIEMGFKTEAMLEFSKTHRSYDGNPVWFYKLNGSRSIIQNGREYELISI